MNTGVKFWMARFAAAASLALASTMATAGPAIVGLSGGSNFPAFNGTNQTIGWRFTVAAGGGITVTDLGWWDASPATPLGQDHQVGIWDLAGALLGSVTVLTNSSLSGAFRYEAITPIALAGGGSYVIGGAITSPFLDVYSNSTTVTTDPLITFNEAARNGSSGGFSAPLTFSAGNGRFGPNFEFTANDSTPVPEPGTALLMMLAGVGMVAASRRRRRVHRGRGNP
jgi:hypothetical protein